MSDVFLTCPSYQEVGGAAATDAFAQRFVRDSVASFDPGLLIDFSVADGFHLSALVAAADARTLPAVSIGGAGCANFGAAVTLGRSYALCHNRAVVLVARGTIADSPRQEAPPAVAGAVLTTRRDSHAGFQLVEVLTASARSAPPEGTIDREAAFEAYVELRRAAGRLQECFAEEHVRLVLPSYGDKSREGVLRVLGIRNATMVNGLSRHAGGLDSIVGLESLMMDADVAGGDAVGLLSASLGLYYLLALRYCPTSG